MMNRQKRIAREQFTNINKNNILQCADIEFLF